MIKSYNHTGLPSNLIHYDCEYVGVISVEEGVNFKSVPIMIIGNATEQVLITPIEGCRLKLKAITLIGEGSVGEAKIHRSSDDAVILPTYFVNNKPSQTSSSFNMVLLPDEYIYITTTGRGATDETFVGITYIGLNGNY